MSRKAIKLLSMLLCLYLIVLGYLLFGRVDYLRTPPDWVIPFDKVVHFLLFQPLSVLLYLLLKSSRHINGFWAALLSILLSLGFALLTEMGQGYLTSYRTSDIEDFYADAIGISISLIIIIIAEKPVTRLLNKICK
ncbi:MAG: VanZ family protein [Bacteroidales bacterium]|nr:VanZ family protein [Bacteroidales bacterium]